MLVRSLEQGPGFVGTENGCLCSWVTGCKEQQRKAWEGRGHKQSEHCWLSWEWDLMRTEAAKNWNTDGRDVKHAGSGGALENKITGLVPTAECPFLPCMIMAPSNLKVLNLE